MSTGLELTETDTVLDHSLGPFLLRLTELGSTRELEASSVYGEMRAQVERVLNSVEANQFAPEVLDPAGPRRALAWNIERGTRLDQIGTTLKHHELLRDRDVLLLTELDHGMARSGNLNIAHELAQRLKLNYAFAPCYLSLVKGSGVEAFVSGENRQALHGNAVMSRFRLLRAHSLPLPNGKDKMRGKEKRIGCQRAVIADVDDPRGTYRVVSLHLDAHSSQHHRHMQMVKVLDHLRQLTPALPVLIGGDWNTSTYNSRTALLAILGFWRRVLMGVHYVITNHYLYPERWFERRLFRELEQRGYNFRDLNAPGVGTLHYDVQDLATNTNMADWIPRWCFRWLFWSLRKDNGRCSLKLDWFAGNRIVPTSGSKPAVVAGLRDQDGPFSDHDPILLEFELTS